jgi:thiol-disulfide isomerase/thioredoxin
MKRLALLPAILLLLAACGPQSEPDTTATLPAPETTQPAQLSEPATAAASLPALQLSDRAGNQLDLSSFKGKKVFLNLWASWCPPCRREMPSIQQLYNQTKGDRNAFILLSVDEDRQKAVAFLESNQLSLPLYFAEGALPALLDVPSIPTTFIFDEQGALIERHDGMADFSQPRYISLMKGQ